MAETQHVESQDIDRVCHYLDRIADEKGCKRPNRKQVAAHMERFPHVDHYEAAYDLYAWLCSSKRDVKSVAGYYLNTLKQCDKRGFHLRHEEPREREQPKYPSWTMQDLKRALYLNERSGTSQTWWLEELRAEIERRR